MFAMILNFYRLAEPPFGVSPDPQFLYLGKTHREALACLVHGLTARRGFTTLIAGAGMGKTTLLYLLLRELQPTTRTAFLSHAHCSARELLLNLLTSLGIEDSGDSFLQMHKKLNDALVREYNSQRLWWRFGTQVKRFVVVIDEAQDLAEPTLELLRVLSNVETPREKLMHFVLSGHPQLAEKLASPQLIQLRQRVSIIARLEPFDAEDTRQYIDHRLRVAGYDFARPLFTPSALDLITGSARGIPRNINNVCFNALSLGYVNRQQTIDVNVIQEVLRDLDLQKLMESGGEVPFVPRSHLSDHAVLEGPVDPKSSTADSRSFNLDQAASSTVSEVGEPQLLNFASAASATPAMVSQTPREADLRRSSRIDHRVSLIVLGTDRVGESVQEETSAISLNLHGCRYSSRHDYPLGGWVTLQVGGEDRANLASVRARVRSVFSSKSPFELCQVGVELETPANVWGIAAPPEDWLSDARFDKCADRKAAAAAASSQPVSPTNQPSAAREPQASVSESVAVTLAELLPVLQDRLQQSADHFAQTAVESRLDKGLRDALAKIDDFWKTNASQNEEFSVARLAEMRQRWEEDLAAHRSLAEETSKRLEILGAEARQGLAELQKFVERTKSEIEPQFNACLNQSLTRAASEFASIAEHVSERHHAELDRNGLSAMHETRSQLDKSIAEMRSLLATVPAGIPEERLESLVDSSRESILKHMGERLAEVYRQFDQQQELGRHRASEFSQQLETLTAGLRETKAQLDQAKAKVRSLSSAPDEGASRELIDSLMHSGKEQIFRHVEDRLNEISARSEQQHDITLQRTVEMTQQLEKQLEKLNAGLRETKAQNDQSVAEVRSLLASRDPGVSQEIFDSLMHSEREQIFKQLECQLGEVSALSDQQHDLARQRTAEMALQLENLAAKTRDMSAQHEQSVAELDCRLADVSSSSSQERLDGLLEIAREQFFNHLETRIGEISGSVEQRQEVARQQFVEISRRLDQLAIKTQTQMVETQGLAERIQASANRAVQEVENSAARISDRQLVRMMEQEKTVARELSLDLEARASETRALVEKSANGALEEFQRRLKCQNELVIAEATERITSKLASLDAEYRIAREIHHQTLKTEVARAAQQSMTEFRSSMKAFLYSCLVAAVSAVDQHAKTTLGGLSNNPNSSSLKLDAFSDLPAEYHHPSSTASSA
jgi:type II secretory pathway predicted ATPase ExeA